MNIYVPTADKTAEQAKFLDDITPLIGKYSDKIILGGGLQGKTTGKQGCARQQRGPCQAYLHVISPLSGSFIAAESRAWAGI